MLFWYRIRHLNPLKMHPERTTIADENMVNDLENADINFLSLKNIIVELKRKIIFVSMCFVLKMVWFILFIYQLKNLSTV